MFLPSTIQIPSLSLRSYILILSSLVAAIIAIESFNRDDEFDSAIGKNVCNVKNVGYGPGRVIWRTTNAQCVDQKTMKARCYIFSPRSTPRHEEDVNFVCAPPLNFCVPKPRNPGLLLQDAGCLRVETGVGGSKGAGDVDDIACSSSISFDAPIFLNSEIKTDKAIFTDSVSICSVERADNNQRLATFSPCQGGTRLNFEARTPYHACITTDPEVRSASVSFKWFLSPVFSAKRKRGLDGDSDGEDDIPSYTIHHREEKEIRPRPQIELHIGNRTELL